ncbi:MAG: CdaR family protein [Thermomicrobiales bacterium]
MNIIDFLRTRFTKIQILRFGISLILAALLWGWVTQLQDPLESTRFSSIPITVNGLSDSLVLVTRLPDGSVSINGPESRVDDVRSSDLDLSIDLSDIDTPGTYRERVAVNQPSGVDSDSLEPREIQIQIEEYVTQNFPLEIVRVQEVDDPRLIRQASPGVSEVTVSGASSAMSRVSRILLPITVAQQTDNFQNIFVPYAVDAVGQRISEVSILPNQVSAYVELETRGKVVSVIPDVVGNPAEGYSVQQRFAVPDTILVDGPEEILETLLIVNTSPVDISGATESVSQRVSIVGLPEGVSVVDPQDGMVEVRVAIEDTTNTSQTIPSLPVEIVDLDPALVAEVDVSTVSITIDAPQSVLQSLAAADIKVRVSAAELTPGVYEVEIEVSVPEGVTLISSDPGTIQLTIQDPSASPDPSPQSNPGG